MKHTVILKNFRNDSIDNNLLKKISKTITELDSNLKASYEIVSDTIFTEINTCSSSIPIEDVKKTLITKLSCRALILED